MARRGSPYTIAIAGVLRDLGADADPVHVEAWIRVEHETLDSLSPSAFAEAVRHAVASVEDAGEGSSESLAVSLGLAFPGGPA